MPGQYRSLAISLRGKLWQHAAAHAATSWHQPMFAESLLQHSDALWIYDHSGERVAIFSVTLLAMAVLINRAYIGFRGVGLTVNTLPVTSVGVGLGVYYALYVIDRIRAEVRHRSLDDAVRVSLSTTVAAVLFTALMVAVCARRASGRGQGWGPVEPHGWAARPLLAP